MTNQQTAKPKKTFIQRHPKKLIFLLVFVLLNYPWFYFGAPIEGYVKDKETGEPIEGVVALFGFSVYGIDNIFQGHETFKIEVMEAVSDENGYYKFPWWVTRKRPFKAFLSSGSGIGFYKMGYKVSGSSNLNRSDGKGRLKMYTAFEHSSSPVFMEKFGSFDEEKELWMRHSGALRWRSGYYEHGCSWKLIPNYLLERDRVTRKVAQSLSKKDQSKAGMLLEEKLVRIKKRKDKCKPSSEIVENYFSEIKDRN